MLYSDPNQHGRLIYIPSDMDVTLGSAATCSVNETITGRYETYAGYNKTRPLIHNILKVPDFKTKFEDVINKVIRRQINHSEFLFNRIDVLSTMLKQDVEWDMSIPRDYITLDFEALRRNLTEMGGETVSATLLDYLDRTEHRKDILFEQAVNGTINRLTLMDVKEWISKLTGAYLQVNPSIIGSSTKETQQQMSNTILSFGVNDE